jgi:hypothetical protein
MAHFAELDDTNTVLQVIVLANETCGEPELAFPDTDSVGRAFIAQTLGLGWNWKQCSYNATFRGAYPGPGWTYDPIADVFISPQPFPSWSLDGNFDWQPPTPMPDDGTGYVWDEANLIWQPVPVA